MLSMYIQYSGSPENCAPCGQLCPDGLQNGLGRVEGNSNGTEFTIAQTMYTEEFILIGLTGWGQSIPFLVGKSRL